MALNLIFFQTVLSGDLPQFFTNKENPNNNTAQPKAFLNWVAFDEQLNIVAANSNVMQVPQIPAGIPAQALVAPTQIITKNGYIYIYVSNESAQKVFFDNLTVHHNRGPLLEETHYYPFGLTMAGISDQAILKPENRFKYNGIELNHKEFSDGSGLELYTAQFRGLDPQIGRWWQVDPQAGSVINLSPYNSMGDNPIIHADPLGDLFFGLFGSTGEQRRAARSLAEATGGRINNLLSSKINVDYFSSDMDFDLGTGELKNEFAIHNVSFRSDGNVDFHDPVRNQIYDQDLA